MRALAVLLLFVWSGACAQVSAPPGEVERRVTELSAQLRCLVCQNQSLAESDAPLARDLKQRVREQVAAGRSDAEIRRYMVERYGDFVLYRPPFRPQTWLLWLGPFALLLAGLGTLAVRLRRRTEHADAPGEPEMRRAARLLDASEEAR